MYAFFYKTFNIYNNQQKTQCSKLSSQNKRDHIFLEKEYTIIQKMQTHKHTNILSFK